jgi:N-hydroxyarylamine O-acetyltransferase
VDGKRYFCDVGFGGPMADRSLELDAAGGQTAGTGVFRFSPNGREIMLCMSSGEGDVPLLSFSDLPADPVDFVALNHYCSRSPESPFLSSRRVHLLTERGRVSLENNVFRRTGSPPVVLRTRDQTARTLAGVFGIEVDKNDLKL